MGRTRHKLSESHGTCLVPSAMSCADTCEMSTREASELKTQGFCWGLVIHVGTLCVPCTTMPNSSWLVFSVNHTVGTKSLGRVGLFLSVSDGSLPQIQVPRGQLRVDLGSRPLTGEWTRPLCSLLLQSQVA